MVIKHATGSVEIDGCYSHTTQHAESGCPRRNSIKGICRLELTCCEGYIHKNDSPKGLRRNWKFTMKTIWKTLSDRNDSKRSYLG